jgi:transketolase
LSAIDMSAELSASIERRRASYPLKAIRQQYGETLMALAADHPDLMVVTGDLMYATGLGGFGARFPDRLVNVGIAEQNMTGIAAGLAAAGRPVIVDGYAAFTTLRAVEQAKLDSAYNGVKLILTGQSAGLSYGVGGPTHQTYEDVAIMRAIPNTVVVVPADAAAVDACLRAALAFETSGPIYIRLGRGEEYLTGENAPFAIGRGRVLRDGNDLAIVANGPMVFEAMLAADHLAADGVGVKVIDMHTAKPLDADLLLATAGRVRAMLVVEEHSALGGLGGAVTEALSEVAHGPIRRLGLPDAFPPIGPTFALREALGLSAVDIIRHAHELLRMRN